MPSSATKSLTSSVGRTNAGGAATVAISVTDSYVVRSEGQSIEADAVRDNGGYLAPLSLTLAEYDCEVTAVGLREEAKMADPGAAKEPGRANEDFVDGLYLGDAIRFFLDAKRAGGRSKRTISEYRKKLDLFQRCAAKRLDGEGAVDAPVSWVGPDEVEGYVVHMRERGLSDSSIKNHLSVIRSFFDTLSRRLDLPDPTRRLDEVRFHQKVPTRTFLTRREADVLLGRTFGTWYLQENPGQLIELAELMGHSNLSQVRKYALSDAERARAGVAKL